jgi:hypothetical protein
MTEPYVPVEQISTYSRSMIEMLLAVHACANMNRSSGDIEYLQTAAGWMPNIESTIRSMRREFERHNIKVEKLYAL